MKGKPRKNKPLAKPAKKLNSAQRAMRLICEEAFGSNMTQMGEVIGKSQPAIRRFIIDGTQSPKYSELEEWAEMVGTTADALIARFSGDLYVSGKWYSASDLSKEDLAEVIQRIAEQAGAADEDGAAALDDV